MDTVVITTWSKWYEPPRIRHQLARQLARFYRVLFVEIPIGREETPQNNLMEQVGDNLYCYRLVKHPRLPFTTELYLPPIHSRVQLNYLQQLREILEEMGRNRLLLFNFNYNFTATMQSDIFDLKVYICNDDFPARSQEKIQGSHIMGIPHRRGLDLDGKGLGHLVRFPFEVRVPGHAPKSQEVVHGH